MALLKESQNTVFDTSEIAVGDLFYGEHVNWPDARSGIVAMVTEKEITVLFHPNISNVYNRFVIPVNEVVEGSWTIRWSTDLKEVKSYEPPTTETTEDGESDGT